MKATELTKKKDADLLKLLKEKRNELREFRFGSAGSKASNSNLKSELKKDIARILTEVNSRRG